MKYVGIVNLYLRLQVDYFCESWSLYT